MKIQSKILIVASIVALSACSTTSGKKFDTSAVDKIKVGQTTTENAIGVLGEPYSRNIAADGTEKWTYRFTEGKGSLSATSFIPVAGGFLGGTKTEINTSTLDLAFTNKVLTTCKLLYTESNEKSSGFMGIQSKGNETSREIACGE